MLIKELKLAFNNTLFYKSGMVKIGLENHFGSYESNVIEEAPTYFVVEMKPYPFAKSMKRAKVKFDFIKSEVPTLNKVINISLVK